MKIEKKNHNIKNSQNFLYDKKLVSRLIANSSISKNDLVYEIGGGKGIITQELALACYKVISIEIDTELSNKLITFFNGVQNIEIVCSDFLSYKLEDVECTFFSNIPFNITTDILNKVLELNNVKDIYFIMQYEAFLRYAGEPYYKECLKSLYYKPFFVTSLFYEFSPTDFKPIPRAKIIFAHFRQKIKPDISHKNKKIYQDFLAYIFGAKGSTIKEKLNKIFTYEQIKRASKTIGFKQNDTISKLKYNQWLALFDVYLNHVPQNKKFLVNNAYKKLLNQQSTLNKVHRNRNYIDIIRLK